MAHLRTVQDVNLPDPLGTNANVDNNLSSILTATLEEEDLSSTDDNDLIQELMSKRDQWDLLLFGNYTTCCRGLLIFRRVTFTWFLLQLLILGSLITFFVEFDKFHWTVIGCTTMLGGLLLVSTISISCLNPGVIKKPNFDTALLNAKRYVRVLGVPASRQTLSRIQDTYCTVCHQDRTPKSKHCRVCNCCVEERDHHCPIIGTCIAKRNMVCFKMMICSLIVYYIFLLVSSLYVAITGYVINDWGAIYSVFSASFTCSYLVTGLILMLVIMCFTNY